MLRDAQGNPLVKQSVSVQVTIYQNTDAVWSEEHLVLTNMNGVFSLVIGDPDAIGSGSAGSFEEIAWGSGNFTIGTEVDAGNGFIDLGRTTLQSVPYALFAAKTPGTAADEDADPENELQDLSYEGNMLTLSGDPTPLDLNLAEVIASESGWLRAQDTITTYDHVGIGTANPDRSALLVQGQSVNNEVPLFEVRREDGVPVFAVYNDGVMVFVDEDSKGAKGGFAVGGYKSRTKGFTQEYMRVTPDSVRIWVPDLEGSKGPKGGFAVGGYNTRTKGSEQDLLYVTADSVRIYVPDTENEPGFVGLQGGFAVNTFSADTSLDKPSEYIMGMNRGITRFNTADNSQGFAIGSQGEGWGSTYMMVTPLNTFVGFESGDNTRPSSEGWDADQGSKNVFLGYSAGFENRYGHHNVYLGYQAGYSSVGDSLDDFNGSFNTFIGPNAGFEFQTGYSNIFIGNGAGESFTDGDENVFLGMGAGESASGFYNVLIGSSSGNNLQGSGNVMLGDYSGYGNQYGLNNVFLGSSAGSNSTSSNSVFIGKYAGYGVDASNVLYIDNSSTNKPLIYGNFSTDYLQFNGSVSINTVYDEYSRFKVEESRTNYAGYAITAYNNKTSSYGTGIYTEGGYRGLSSNAIMTGGGSRIGVDAWAYNGDTNYGLAAYGYGGNFNYGIYAYSYGGTSYAVYASGNLAYTGSLIAASDQKFKEDIETIRPVLNDLMKLKPRSYQTIGSEETKGYGIQENDQYGFVAQELEQVFPDLVVDVYQPVFQDPETKGSPEETMEVYKGVKYLEMIPILLKGMQEQQAEIELLKQRIAQLEGENQ